VRLCNLSALEGGGLSCVQVSAPQPRLPTRLSADFANRRPDLHQAKSKRPDPMHPHTRRPFRPRIVVHAMRHRYETPGFMS
jgi:hypothetical protein